MKDAYLVMVIGLLSAVFLTACNGNGECEPESDAELCGERGCGSMLRIDDCGEARQLDCGQCPDEQDCTDNQCHCQGETPEKLCADHDIECGQSTVVDACGDERQIDCGGCQNPEVCIDNLCGCESPSQAQICFEEGFECGPATVADPCDNEREIHCGFCPDGETCTDNECACDPETDSELCSAEGLECGSASATDRCGDSRSLDCGDCSGLDECSANQCECVGESEADLCDDLDGACDTHTVVDGCGDDREIDCGPCPTGDTTFGAVRDGDSGSLIADADVRIYTWPPPEGQAFDWQWPAGHRADDPDFSTTTDSSSGDINYEFATDEPICIDDQIASLQPHQWYRIVVEHPDYNPGIFYRLHEGYDPGDCPEICPTAGGGGCHRQDFEIWPDDAVYAQYPNLLVDKRELEQNEWQCTLMPPDSPHDRLIGIRVRVGAANVGQGDFHLEGVDVDGGQVLQHVYYSDGSTESRVVESGTFEFYEDHRHTHFMDWFGLRFVDPREDCRDVDSRPSDCEITDGLKISFCLHDLDLFDGDVSALYDGVSSRFPDPPVCETTEQGVTLGWKDTYNRHLPGQVLIVGSPADAAAIDEAWIEAEVDPEQVLAEQERHGNIARHLVDVPSSPADLCDDAATTLDCSMPPSEYTSTQQQRQCRDYLNH